MKKKQDKADDKAVMRIQPRMDDYELDEAIRTLSKAEEIKADGGMMKKIKPLLDKKYKSIEALKELYNSKYNQPGMDDAEEDAAEGEESDD